MGPVFYVMAILGCGDGEAACQQVRVAEARYASADACSQATPAVLMRNSDLSFPVVSAQCRAATAATAARDEARFPRG